MIKKLITFILSVCIMLNAVPVLAESDISDVPDNHNIITLYSDYDEVFVGEKIRLKATISLVENDVSVNTLWKVNGEAVEEFPETAITLQENMQLEFNYVVPPCEEACEMTVSLSLYDQDNQIISSSDKVFIINKDIPVSIISTTKVQKALFDQKVTPSIQVMNETGREFDYKAHWELNGKRVEGYDFEHFILGYSADSSCQIALSSYAGKKVNITFILDNGLSSTSMDIEIEVLNYPPEVIYQQKVAEMRKIIKTVEIECTLVKDSNVYKEMSLKKKIAYKEKGVKGIYVNYYETNSAKVRFSDGTTGWVPYGSISISKTNYTDLKGCRDELKEIFVNENGYKSDTKYMLWISLKFQQVNVFTGEKGKWKLDRSMTCATGRNKTPTIIGVFKYFQYQDRWNFGKYYVAPIMRFNGGTALHSRTYKPDGSLLDPTLGKPASHGCVRMKQEDIDWLAKNIPLKTTVVVY